MTRASCVVSNGRGITRGRDAGSGWRTLKRNDGACTRRVGACPRSWANRRMEYRGLARRIIAPRRSDSAHLHRSWCADQGCSLRRSGDGRSRPKPRSAGAQCASLDGLAPHKPAKGVVCLAKLLGWLNARLLAIRPNVRRALEDARDPSGRTLRPLSCSRLSSACLPAMHATTFDIERSLPGGLTTIPT